MLSMVDVQCPHCGAQGQIILPPLCSVIVGPCPQCHEFIVIFCGQVLPLEKDIMMSGTPEERRQHLLAAIMAFLEERLGKMDFEFRPPEEGAEALGVEGESDAEDEMKPLENLKPFIGGKEKTAKPLITQSEIDSFVKVDLHLLDNKEYFKAVFD